MRFFTGTQRCGDGRNGNRDTAHACHTQRHQTRERDDGPSRNRIARTAQNGHAGQELPGQGHQHQGQRQAQDGTTVPFGCDPLRPRGCEVHLAQRQTRAGGTQGDARTQHQHQEVAWKQTLPQQVGGDHAEGEQRHAGGGTKRPDTKLEQDASHHAKGNALGNAVHQPVETARQANRQQNNSSHQVGAHRLRHADVRKQRHQQGRARGRPSGDDGHAQPPTEHDASQRRTHRDAPHPRGHHGRRYAR